MNRDGQETRQHALAAREFLEAADREFAMGDKLQGSEKLWGAACQAVIAIAQQRGWPHNSHSAMKDSVTRLAKEHDDPALQAGYAVAEKLHANFYHGFMEDYQLIVDSALVRRFVERALDLAA